LFTFTFANVTNNRVELSETIFSTLSFTGSWFTGIMFAASTFSNTESFTFQTCWSSGTGNWLRYNRAVFFISNASMNLTIVFPRGTENMVVTHMFTFAVTCWSDTWCGSLWSGDSWTVARISITALTNGFQVSVDSAISSTTKFFSIWYRIAFWTFTFFVVTQASAFSWFGDFVTRPRLKTLIVYTSKVFLISDFTIGTKFN
jgi:hypothetical protein